MHVRTYLSLFPFPNFLWTDSSGFYGAINKLTSRPVYEAANDMETWAIVTSRGTEERIGTIGAESH